jgi:hypothetical protein
MKLLEEEIQKKNEEERIMQDNKSRHQQGAAVSKTLEAAAEAPYKIEEATK